ncbi:DUF3375 domain-containing protein [Vineibacter terrae]|uniref:DUF3375 domain-containing protein n=1 Tax=Vineibacter terrae TaxID=2586908 RepID=A0A5C8PSL4_9HYPH|nr:DUF3375 domain-containing protein [Vineibacter terrae]TXL78771.1 DUF3375 domain-containing protein [Vineibacter terrae]
MDYQAIEFLRRTHPAWRLLAADHAPLIVSFLFQAFVQPNVRTLAQQALAAQLDDHLFHLREQLRSDLFPKAAIQYLDDWAADERGWLRKYYPPGNDEPHYDITPATERAIDWLSGLTQRQFIGTESRLMTVFELLRQIVQGTELDPTARVAALEQSRAKIDAEIRRIRDGQLALMDETQIKDRFLQMAATARGLLSDFREVEQNFRNLDRAVRERIATWEASKGALLHDILGQRDAITDSDQGKSFRAFWDFLMSPARQDELSALLQAVFDLAPVKELAPDLRLLRIHYDWLEAGEVAQRTVARLSQQLRRYLDDQAWLENRRIMNLIRQIEQHALDIRHQPPDKPLISLDETAPDLDLTLDRPLFTPPFKPTLDDAVALAGDEDIPADALFEQIRIDKARLAANVRRALQIRNQITLAELVREHPLEHGLAELIAYMSLAADDRAAVIDDDHTQHLHWTDAVGITREAVLPQVIFQREVSRP